ncbi:MAG: Stp1/IreP family PP2C-type Ser/Thr phosphatase, partial [Acidimicrobiales bacterium]
MTTLRWGAVTDVGRRRTINQDRVLETGVVFAVADGVGGHNAGEVASLTAVEALRAAYTRSGGRADLIEAVREANRAVWARAGEVRELRGMGTTLTAIALVESSDGDLLEVANVGDSRAYLFRDGEITQITVDHSMVEELRRRGEITDDEAAVHPDRHVITRVLGMGPEVEPDLDQLVPYRGDRLVLCSDGLSNEVLDREIAAVLRRLADPREVARELVRTANARGGNDNISVVVIDVVDDDDRAGVASAQMARAAGASRG